MTENRQSRYKPALCLLGAVMAGAACTRFIPSDWFLHVLGYSIFLTFIIAVLASLGLENERREPIPFALLLGIIGMSSRNGEIKMGRRMWAFLVMVGFVTGILVSACLLARYL